MAKFKVGDRVRYVHPNTMCLNVGYGGARGTIVSVDEDTYYFEEGNVTSELADDVGGEFEMELFPFPKKFPEQRKETVAKFKVGDRVRYVNKETAECLRHDEDGARGVIVGVDDNDYYFGAGPHAPRISIRFGDQVGGEFELELSPEKTPVQTKPQIVVGVYRYFSVTKVEGGKVGITAHATLSPVDLDIMARQFTQMAEVLRNS